MSSERGGVLGQVDVVVARALDSERRVGRGDLHRVAGRQLAQVEGGVTRDHAKLHVVRLLVVEADLRPVAGAHVGPRPELDLDVTARPGVEEVAGRQGRVDPGLRPLLGAGAPEGHLAVDVADAGRRGLGGLPRGRRRILGQNECCAAHHQGEHHERADDSTCPHCQLLSAGRIEAHRVVRVAGDSRGDVPIVTRLAGEA